MAKPSERPDYRDVYQAACDKVHEAGSRRHPQEWFNANRAAVQAMWAAHVDTADPQMRYLVALTVLRVLDTTKGVA